MKIQGTKFISLRRLSQAFETLNPLAGLELMIHNDPQSTYEILYSLLDSTRKTGHEERDLFLSALSTNLAKVKKTRG